VETNGQTDTTDRIIFPTNAVGHPRSTWRRCPAATVCRRYTALYCCLAIRTEK